MSYRIIQAASAVAAALCLLPDAQATIPDANGVYSACYTKSSSTIRVIDTADTTCKSNETMIHWNQAGPTGPQGPAGPQGAPGLAGAQGPAGPQGDQGPAGAQGAQGPQGPAGSQGEQGLTGAQGPAGPQGDQGLAGAQGPAGAQGDQGPEGAQGPAGAQGDQGLAGAQGSQGPAGLDGQQGPAGPKGDTGDTGPMGPAGPAGGGAAAVARGPCYYNTDRYQDCDNGTVTDTVTGLIWLKDANCFGRKMTWVDANQAAGDLAAGTCGLKDGSSAGDWRLPTTDEWKATVARAIALTCHTMTNGSLVVTDTAGTACYAKNPQSVAFTNVPLLAYPATVSYWSSITNGTAPLSAYAINLASSSTTTLATVDKTVEIYVWPVRSKR